MKFAEDFRRIARNALTNRWLIAVVVGLVAALLGATGTEGGPEVKLNIDASNADVNFSYAGQTIFSTGTNGALNSDVGAWIVSGFGFVLIAAVIMGLVYFVLGSFIGVGYAKFNLNLIDRKAAAFETLFEYFVHWKIAATMRFLRSLYTLLWTLLFIIPGIVMSLSYVMSDFILAENPELTATEVIEQSKAMMYGNRWRFFCLQFSFIGWDILAALSFGIGGLWLRPYKQAAYAAFYREVSGTEHFAEGYDSEAN